MNPIDRSVIRALSIQQPWAYCITHSTKRVENRTWYTSYRGLFIIHASKTYQVGMEQFIHADSPEVPIHGMLASTRGAFAGAALLTDCVRPDSTREIASDQQIWSDPAQCRFVLKRPVALVTPIAYLGNRGFFTIDPAVLERILCDPAIQPLIT